MQTKLAFGVLRPLRDVSGEVEQTLRGRAARTGADDFRAIGVLGAGAADQAEDRAATHEPVRAPGIPPRSPAGRRVEPLLGSRQAAPDEGTKDLGLPCVDVRDRLTRFTEIARR